MVPVQVHEEWAVIEQAPGSGAGPIFVGERELAEQEAIKILLVTEQVNVSKERTVVEGVSFRKEVATYDEAVTTTLNREELVVDDPANLAVERFGAPDMPISTLDSTEENSRRFWMPESGTNSATTVPL